MKFTACILNSDTDIDSDRFTQECLEQMIEHPNIPLKVDFEHTIGQTEKVWYENGQVFCSGILFDDLVPVVGFVIKDQEIKDGVRVIKEMELKAISLTDKPVTEGTYIE